MTDQSQNGGPDGAKTGTPQVVSRRALTTWMSTSASAVALIVSGVSLWETALKQPQLKVYVGDNISYTRDPWGSYEVFVVPVTITNSGARDGAVMNLQLELTNSVNGEKDNLESSYTADASWYSGSDNVTTRTRRPKSLFSPLSISGRSSWSGTVLFYSTEAKEKKIAEPRSQVTGRISVTAARNSGWIDQLFASRIESIPVGLTIPNYLPGAVLSGDVIRLRGLPSASSNSSK